MDIVQAIEVFTPSTPARIAFVERYEINDKLVNAITTPGKQIVVYGHSGSGKTTLLVNKLKQLYEGHITTRCMKGMKFEQIILDAFDQLAPYYQIERTIAKKNTQSVDLAATYLAIQSKLNSSQTFEQGSKEVRILPPQLTPQTLGRLLGAAKACWLIEDFHKIDEGEKPKLSQLMKIFMDLADEHTDLKIIALGAVDTARQVVDYDSEMRNRVAEIQVKLMSEPEIMEIIHKGEEVLNVVIGDDIKKLISRYSNGLASVCHHLCLNMCRAEGVSQTTIHQTRLTRSSFEAALKMYVEEASDSIRSAFDKALKLRRKSAFNSQELILRTLTMFKERGAGRVELYRKIQENHPSYSETNLKTCLAKLQTAEYGEMLRYDATSGYFSFSDPIFRAYALVHFREPEQVDSHPTNDLAELMRQLKMELKKHFPQERLRVTVDSLVSH